MAMGEIPWAGQSLSQGRLIVLQLCERLLHGGLNREQTRGAVNQPLHTA